MTYFAITAQYPIFTDLNGLPLENGYVYIGEENANPITDPITVYWDDGLLYPAAQPIRTLAGAPNRNGSPSPVYVPTSFSILVQDRTGQQVYYSPSGIKNYTDNSLALRRNQIINGRFEVYHTIKNPTLWQADVNTYTLTQTPTANDYTLFVLDTNPYYYMRLSAVHGGTPAADDYARYATVIEDVTAFNGEIVTLSFLARSSNLNKIATSIDQFEGSTNITTGIGATLHTLTTSFRRYSVTVQMPQIEQSTFEGLSTVNDTGNTINFWVAAGSDFDTQTNGIGNQTGLVDIADVRFNRGAIIDTSDRRTIAEEIALTERYVESSYNMNISDFGAITSPPYGAVAYTAPDTGSDIEGVIFRQIKRTTTPTVTIYSPATGTSGVVDHSGTGDEAATAFFNDKSITAVSLDVASLVDQDTYLYHYVVNDEFTLP